MKWVFLSLVVANIAFAIAAQLKGGDELQYSRLELNPDKIQLVLRDK
ncbi:MAG: hypothetical protein ACR2FI_00350 [Burkholderiales bacterium]|nr:hypothetical protein [Burkholderiales bacterium]MDQ3197239.1 hypothetical protein [Pseudomonadota bacterium]